MVLVLLDVVAMDQDVVQVGSQTTSIYGPDVSVTPDVSLSPSRFGGWMGFGSENYHVPK